MIQNIVLSSKKLAAFFFYSKRFCTFAVENREPACARQNSSSLDSAFAYSQPCSCIVVVGRIAG